MEFVLPLLFGIGLLVVEVLWVYGGFRFDGLDGRGMNSSY